MTTKIKAPKRKAIEHHLFRRWNAINQALHNPNSPDYRWGGARGIKEEFGSFWEFADYVDTHLGHPTGDKTLLRRIDVMGNYKPGNLEWADHKTLGRNNSVSAQLTYKNKTQSISDWADEYGLHVWCIKRRLAAGWTVKNTLLTPADTKYRRKSSRVENVE